MIHTLLAPFEADSMPEVACATRRLALAALTTAGVLLPAGTIYEPVEGGLDAAGRSYSVIDVAESEPLP